MNEEIAACKDALAIQDACNTTAVANCMARHCSNLSRLKGSEFASTHPSTILFIDKLASLAKIQNFGNTRIMQAFEDCEKIASNEGEDNE